MGVFPLIPRFSLLDFPIVLPTVTPAGIWDKVGLQVLLSESCQGLIRTKMKGTVYEVMETPVATQGMATRLGMLGISAGDPPSMGPIVKNQL